MVDRAHQAILAVDLATGNRSVVSDNDDLTSPDAGAMVGSGPGLTTPRDLWFDSGAERLFVLDSGLNAVLMIDLSAGNVGNRSVFSDDTDSTNADVEVGTGPAFTSVNEVAYDAPRNRLLVTNNGLSRGVIAVDLTNGNRSFLSSSLNGVGSGWPMRDPFGILALGDKAYVLQRNQQLLMTIELSGANAGYREVVASGATVESYF